MNTVTRYFRAFIIALRMTLRGQQPPGLRHPDLYAWIKQIVPLVGEVSAAVDAAGLDQRTTFVRLDGRRMSLDRVLQIFHYHGAQEYPSLLATSGGGRFNIGAIQATNMNDRFWLTILREDSNLQHPAVQAALARLSAHLDAVPSTSKPTPST